ncbi:hypothetical protein BDV98DRAFT_574657 [Pterulicium gracile]|uniref:Cx9C motif-containing protein 4, mitochondrial n=1 Tax=Pterulicium gracile TaxID=1884261 RepID=A0A5C3QAB2_9AGAR|nr:hypothetical protein BDV98DRAFT_574657 [Pterula gracilis]
MSSDEPGCQAEACALQTCLNKNTYSPDKCNERVKQLYLCCQRFYKETDDKGESTACPMPRVVERWLKDHGGGAKSK